MTLAVRPWVVGVPTVPLITHYDAWNQCKRAIKAVVGDAAYYDWLGGLSFVEVRRHTLRLSVASRFLQKWIQRHYRAALLEACQSEWPAVTEVEIVVRSCVLKDLRSVPVLLLPPPTKVPAPWAHLFPYTPQVLFPGHPEVVRAKIVPSKIKIEDIQRVVARQYNVSRFELLSAQRTANVVRPRQVAMYLCKTLTLRSLPEIGRRFGGRDHTTVLHAVNKIAWLIGERTERVPSGIRNPSVEVDTLLKEEVELLKQQLQE